MECISAELIKWYDEHHRDLPWRDTTDPYAVWISEIILQQTRVAQGYDYYVRFMREFPTVESLAAADEDRVMRAWQGLGYYSRARNLHAAARQVVEQGGFPTTYEGLLQLKGVGEYTAAAIGSFSFGLPVAVVDGNVSRVLSRLFGMQRPIDRAAGKMLIHALAARLLPEGQSAQFNQAIMEFGALQCVPRNPDCLACPFSGTCFALEEGKVGVLPVKSHKQKVTERWFCYYYIHNDERMYVHKRTADDIWHGLYELPLVETDGSAEGDDIALPFPCELNVASIRFRGGRKHVLSHQVIHAQLYEVSIQGELPSFSRYNIIRIEDAERYAFPRLLTLLLEGLDAGDGAAET